MSLHYLFVCTGEANDCIPIQSTTPTIVDALVPGYLRRGSRVSANKKKVSKVQKLLSDEARIHVNAVIRWILRLHKSGKSLNGEFSISNLSVDPCQNIKCADTKRMNLKRVTPKRKTKDFKKVGMIIKHDILGVLTDSKLPNDVKRLLDTLNAYQQGYEILIENHPGLKTESEKISMFNRMYAELETLMVTDRPKYDSIIQALPYGNDSWRPSAFCNIHVHAVYTYRNRMGSYDVTSEGAVRLYWNCFQYLIKDHSTMTQGGATVVLFVYRQIEHIMGTLIPSLIVKLMEAMSNEAVLENVFD